MSEKRTYEVEGYFDGNFTHYKKQAIQAAKDLHYGKAVVKKLESAKSDIEIERIMATARRNRK